MSVIMAEWEGWMGHGPRVKTLRLKAGGSKDLNFLR